jgi:hypothetical protein
MASPKVVGFFDVIELLDFVLGDFNGLLVFHKREEQGRRVKRDRKEEIYDMRKFHIRG